MAGQEAMMDPGYQTTAELSLSHMRLERLVQDRSGPFERVHCLDRPSLVYLSATGGGHALGCFGEPRSHRSFSPFGSAVVVPAHMALHVRSPGFAAREMTILRFDETAFGDLTGVDALADDVDLAACTDVRATGVIAALERLSSEFARPATAHETIVAGLGMLVLGELARHFEAARDRATGRGGTLAAWQVRRIEERLVANDRFPPDVEELAALCGIGRRHLMRAYKATTGTTVMARVQQTLFDRAAHMLDVENRSVKAVAGALGYDSQGSFATAFRRRFGQTPTDWRAGRRAAH
jgi:AraC family transcriptional regulator